MTFIEHCTIPKKTQSGCMGTEWLSVYWWLTLVIAWLTGRCRSLLLPSVIREYQTTYL